MLQLHLALNLLDTWPVQLSLLLSEHLAPVHRLCVLAPVQEPRRLPAADAGGGPILALPRGRARPACEPLTSPGAVKGAQNQVGGAQNGGGGLCYVGKGGQRGGRVGERVGGNTEGSSSNVSGASGVSATRDDKYLVGGVDGYGGSQGRRGLATGDVVPQKTCRTKSVVAEEEGAGSAGRRQRWRRGSDAT